CAANLAFLIGFCVTIVPALQTVFALDRTLDPQLNMWQLIGIGGSLGAIVAVINAYVAWGSDNRGFFGRVKETIIALACIGFAWFAWSMHLLDLSLRY